MHTYLSRISRNVSIFVCLATGVLWSATLEVEQDNQAIAQTEAIPLVSYADVIDRAAPAVVSVYTTDLQTYSRSEQSEMGEVLRQFGYRVPYGRSIPEQREVHGLGSGVILSKDGYIITNNHVVRDQGGEPVDEIRVQLKNGDEYFAELIGTDAKTDVAVIKIDADIELDAVVLADSEKIRTGDIVFAIGSPHGQSQTVTQGIVSATERTSLDILGPGSYENFIQTDAAINLGNSGGALIDAWGRLIGINTAIVSRSGGSIGLGYAIPINMVMRVARSLIEIGEVPRGLLGLFPVDLTLDLAEAFDLDSTRGALVNEVQEGSPAEQGGIRHGDIITRIDDISIESAAQLRLTVSQMAPGREVEVTLIRRGKVLEKTVVLGSLNGKLSGSKGRSVLEGVELSDLDSELRKELQLPELMQGVLVRSVAEDSPFAKRLRPNMVIVEVNDVSVDAPNAVGKLLQTGVNSFYVWFEGNPRFIVIRIDD
ncbi:MAG: Do family serine endopeptidase [Coraliomargaritaceae bacterium]